MSSIVAIFATVVSAYSDELRYQVLPCQYSILKKLEEDNRKIHKLFIGSSRSLESIDALTLNKNSESEIHIDFSRSWRASGMSVVMAKDILKRKEIDHIYFEANNRSKNLLYHAYWYSIATYANLVEDLFVENGTSLIARLQHFTTTLAKKVSADLNSLFSGKVSSIKSRKYSRKDYDCSPQNPTSRIDSLQKRKNSKWQSQTRSWNFLDKTEQRNDYYFKKIKKVSNHFKTKLSFIYYPRAYTPVLDSSFVAQFEQRYNIELLNIRDKSLLSKLYTVGYRDATHLILPGQKIFATWLLKQN